jgi:DNA-directed RNA polymerase subunit omega
MKSKYLNDAIQRIPSPELLVNVVSRRVRQLTQGHKPMIQVEPKMELHDVALKEIADGKLSFEMVEGEEVAAETEVAK